MPETASLFWRRRRLPEVPVHVLSFAPARCDELAASL
jgi:hypothetical protein